MGHEGQRVLFSRCRERVIERLAEIQYCHIYLGSTVEGREYVIYGDQELCFTTETCYESEPEVEICQNVVFSKIGHEMAANDVLKELTWDRRQGVGTVL